MTKDELLAHMITIGGNPTLYIKSKRIYEFFNSNICIPKGTNRHPYADVLHKWIENCNLELQGRYKNGKFVKFSNYSKDYEFRIKPYELVYEYRVCMCFKDGTHEYTEKYFTELEYKAFGFPTSCMLEDDTKRERK